MKKTQTDQNSEVIIGYLPSKDESLADAKFKRKFLISFAVSSIYLIGLGLIHLELIKILFGAVILVFVVILPLSIVTEHKSFQRKVIKLPMIFFVQVIIPTVVVIPFERVYGIFTFSVFFLGLVYLIFDIIFVKSMKSKGFP